MGCNRKASYIPEKQMFWNKKLCDMTGMQSAWNLMIYILRHELHNSHSISRHTKIKMKKLVFTCWIFQSWIVLCCGYKLSDRNFRLALVRGLTEEGRRVPWPQTTPWGRPTPSTSQPKYLEMQHTEHWTMEGKQVQCCVQNKDTRKKYDHSMCNVAGVFWSLF